MSYHGYVDLCDDGCVNLIVLQNMLCNLQGSDDVRKNFLYV